MPWQEKKPEKFTTLFPHEPIQSNKLEQAGQAGDEKSGTDGTLP
jgi:hypothetical protein